MTEDDSHSERERAVQQAEAHELLTNIEEYVNGPILNQDDLARAAVEIRQLLADEDGTCLCQFCIDPVKICSCYKGEGSDECDDGRQHQAVDGEA